MKYESVECHIIVLRFGSTLARKVEKLIGVAKAINGLHRIYVNIFGKTKTEKHDPLFVYLSLVKTIEKFQPLFKERESVHFFTDGGPHYYKSKCWNSWVFENCGVTFQSDGFETNYVSFLLTSFSCC